MSNVRYALLVASLLIPASAGAQSIPSPLRYIEETQSIGAFAGYLFNDTGDDDLGPRPAPIFGATYGVRFAGPLSGEFSLAASPSSRKVFELVGTGSEAMLEERGETSALLAMADAALKFHVTGPRAWHGLAPYAVAGVGAVADLSERPAIEEELGPEERFDFGPAFAVVVGLGTDWFPSERLALRLEVRDRLWRLATPAGMAVSGREESAWTNNIGVSLGAALYF